VLFETLAPVLFLGDDLPEYDVREDVLVRLLVELRLLRLFVLPQLVLSRSSSSAADDDGRGDRLFRNRSLQSDQMYG
jgi:hypothetical protein